MNDLITSAQNPRIRLIRSLIEQPKARYKQQAFVAEGARLVADGLKSATPPKFLLYSEQHTPHVAEVLDQLPSSLPAFPVDRRLFNTLSETENSQGLLAVFDLPAAIPPAEPDFLLILDQLRDPGNLGTILRSAEAAGAQAVCLTPGSTDPWAPKVVRSGMGAHFRLPILQMNWQELGKLVQGMQVIHADMNGQLACWQADFTGRTTLLVGGEAEGISSEAGAHITQSVRIPMIGQNESLNAAVSASVLLFEVLRQRMGNLNP